MSGAPEVFADLRLRLGSAPVAAIAPLILWPNSPFDQPSPSDLTARWMAVEVSADNFAPYELGNGLWTEDGQLLIHILIVAGTGIDLDIEVTGAVREAFRYNHTTVIYRRMSKSPGSIDGMWWKSTVLIDYHFESVANPPS